MSELSYRGCGSVSTIFTSMANVDIVVILMDHHPSFPHTGLSVSLRYYTRVGEEKPRCQRRLHDHSS